MRRTLTMAAAVATLLLPAGPLPGAGAGGGAQAAVGRWSAREAQAFWTAERMASAAPLPPAEPAPPAGTLPAEAPSGPVAEPGEPVPPSTPTPAAPSSAPATAPEPAPVRRPAAALPAAAAPGVGQNFDGIPVVGRMFVVKGAGSYFCTASVVASPGRNLVLSAAHCLLGADTQRVAFVPRYTRAKPQPYGMFPVLRDAAGRSRIWIDPRYRSRGVDRAAGLDVAFAQVGPNAAGVPVQNVVGGNRLVTGAGYAHPQVTLIGYPSSAARPRRCVNRTTKFTSRDARIPGSFLRIDCTGYPGGTSGGPFLVRYDARTRTGDVVGVIGGWKTGGDTADTSYSSYFGSDIRKLYAKAVAGAKAG
ncbi:trypsin-like peptidase domain-containing protein [Streptomyces sp. NPDC048270]|uniref:trypsin-like peptidase domain-containing protein n=1 Tax=Streptomyces sp. NPDC048270 TaxID=3154615 RepID=UPI0033EF264E